jgi:hypothetical protein
MAENTWFSFFTEGVKLLGTLWKTKKVKKPTALFANSSANALWTRHIAVHKAKVARAHAVRGHGAPDQANLYGRALETGQCALFNCRDATMQFLQLVWLFIPSFFRQGAEQRAMVAQAMQWLQQGAAKWKGQPWYGIIFRQLQARCQAIRPRRGTGSLPLQAQEPHQVVATALQQGGAAVNLRWCNSILSSSSQTIRQALYQIQRGDQNGFGSFERLHLCGGSEGNKSKSGQTFNSMVCDQKGGKVETNYRLQRNKPIPGTKTFQVGKLERNVTLPQKRIVGCKDRFEKCLLRSWHSRNVAALHLHKSRGQSVPISRGMIWHEYPAQQWQRFMNVFLTKWRSQGFQS